MPNGNTTLTVAAKDLVSVSVAAVQAVAVGLTRQLSAIGTYSDGTTADLTGSATWVSSSPAIATIAAGGLATGAADGVTTMTATVTSISGSTLLSAFSGLSVPTHYAMRGYHTIMPIGYYYWTSISSPDPTGAYAPYPDHMTDIIVVGDFK